VLVDAFVRFREKHCGEVGRPVSDEAEPRGAAYEYQRVSTQASVPHTCVGGSVKGGDVKGAYWWDAPAGDSDSDDVRPWKLGGKPYWWDVDVIVPSSTAKMALPDGNDPSKSKRSVLVDILSCPSLCVCVCVCVCVRRHVHRT
jgi:hypothetical protein